LQWNQEPYSLLLGNFQALVVFFFSLLQFS
jgi:hypothetical protein